VAILAYLPRERARLEATVCAYAEHAAVVRKILVQWNAPDAPPPAFDCPGPVPVDVAAFPTNSLVNRYRLPEGFVGDGDEPVLLQDDDVRYEEDALRAFAAAYALFPDSVLGAFPRFALRDGGGGPSAYASPLRKANKTAEVYGQYNMLTGKTNVLSAATARAFLRDVPRKSLDFIESHKPTCEDMTLHWHAANRSAQPPIWLRFAPSDARELDGAARLDGAETGEMHLDVEGWSDLRARCVDRLYDDYGGEAPLVRSVCRVDVDAPGPRGPRVWKCPRSKREGCALWKGGRPRWK
jgi:hypothetical protein